MTLVYPPIVTKFPFANSELQRFCESLEANGVESKALSDMKGYLKARDDGTAGCSGIAVLLESHPTIHTRPEDNFFSFDIYTCTNFDADALIAKIKSSFDIEEIGGLVIDRMIGCPPKTQVVGNAS